MAHALPPHIEENSRFLERWPLREALLAAGWSFLALACFALGHPVSTALFSADGDSLKPAVTNALGWLRLVLATSAFLLLAAARRPWARRPLPIMRGTAFFCATAILLALVLAEAALRVRGLHEWGSALRTPLPLSAMRPSGEWGLRPGYYANRVTSDFDSSRSRVVFFTINRFGFRGRSPRAPKAEGRPRIICLGGSTTFGYHVTDGEDWPARLGERLGGVGQIEVINAGRPGATTWSDFRALRDRLVRFEPDVVILYEGFNDLWRGVRRHAAVQEDYGPVDEETPPTPETLDLGPPRGWPLRASFAAFQVGRRLEYLFDKEAALPEPALGQLFHPAIVDLYARNLAAQVRLIRAHGAVPVVATFAGCDDPRAGAEELGLRLRYVLKEIPPLDAATAVRGLDLYREQTRRVADREGAPLVDLARLMSKDTAFYSDTVHFTAPGEARLAELLAAALQAIPEVSSRLTDGGTSRLEPK